MRDGEDWRTGMVTGVYSRGNLGEIQEGEPQGLTYKDFVTGGMWLEKGKEEVLLISWHLVHSKKKEE